MIIKKAELETVCGITGKFPNNKEPEIVFAGKSNVGKSSLINALMNRKSLARTSGKPGKTQTINYYKVNDELYFVDLPGYGFAKVPEAVKRSWGNTIETYLKSDREKVVFLLLDLRRIPSNEDIEMLRWLEHYNIEYYIIFTKSDKLSNNEKAKQLKEIRKKLEFSNDDVFFSSALKNTGKDELLEFIYKKIKENNKK